MLVFISFAPYAKSNVNEEVGGKWVLSVCLLRKDTSAWEYHGVSFLDLEEKYPQKAESTGKCCISALDHLLYMLTLPGEFNPC